jgi:hypothetical protein
MAAIPYTRIAQLLNIPASDLPAYMRTPYGHRSTSTPTTLSGCETGISSYQLTIAFKDGGDWFIYADRNSPTTNRHLSATRAVIESQGYTATDDIKTLNRGMGRHATYRRYAKAS